MKLLAEMVPLRRPETNEPLGSVLVIGGGLVAAEIGLALAQDGARVHISSPAVASPVIDPDGHHVNGAAAVRSWISARHAGADVRVAPHWTATTTQHRMVIVAAGTVQPDRAITEYLTRRLVPHLVVRAHRNTAVVGPFVTHQEGACLACLDLALVDHDTQWPRALGRSATQVADPSPTVARWAGSRAALEAAWCLRGRGTTLSGATVEIDTRHSGEARRRWAPHPDCSCQRRRHLAAAV